MPWTKTGFELATFSDLTYKDLTSRICELHMLISTHNSDISAITQTEADSQMLKDQLQIAGFTPPVIEINGKKITLRSSNRSAITNFLQVIKGIAPNFNEIGQEISRILRVDLSQSNPNPHWFLEKLTSDDWYYRNTNTNSIISQINLFTLDGALIKISAATPAHFQSLHAALLNAGLLTDDVKSSSTSKTITCQSRNRTTITNFMKVIKTLSLNFDEIESEFSQKLGIDLNQAYAVEQPVWTKEGDFSRHVGAQGAGALIHACTYCNNNMSAIRNLHLCQYRDGQYKIWFSASSDEHYQTLIQRITQAGFPTPSRGDHLTRDIRIQTSDKQIIANFLNVIKQHVPEFLVIEQEVYGALGVNPGQPSAIMPTWIQESNFNTRFHYPGSSLVRQVSYRTGNTQSVITGFDLYGYTENECTFTVKISGNSEQLRRSLIALGISGLTFNENGTELRLRFNVQSQRNFDRLIVGLSQHSTHFNEIADSFKQHVMPVISANTASEFTFFNRGNASTSPVTDTNQNKLDNIGFSEENLATKEEKENYSRYCCAISTQIMTEPVYDPRFPQYLFDKAEILRWLAIKQEHPYTRAKLTASELTLNLPLRAEIEAFVNSQRSAATKKSMLNDRLDNAITHYEQRKNTPLESQVREELKAHANDVMRLVAADVTLDDLLKLNSSVRKIVIECSSRVVELVERGVNLSRLNDMHIDDVSILLKMDTSDDANTILTSLLDKKPRSIG